MTTDHPQPVPRDDDQRWHAVLARDDRFDGAFVYAVRSTGIFCRPSCPSRRPRRPQVAFFPVPEAARQAGFRPCKRCRPLDAAAADPRVAVVRRLCRAIADATEGADGLPTLAALAARVGGSPHHLQRTFKAVMGISPRRYAEALRLDRLKEALKGGEAVAPALYGAGYGSSSRLYEKAPGHLGMTPASYARGGRGARIAFAVADSPLGRLLVAATGRGVCAVSLGDDDEALETALRADYPRAEIRRDDGALADAVAAVLAGLDGDAAPHRALPLDLRATAFQWRVWERLQAIPRGRVATYGAIAADLGRPGAARAVGRACASNPVSLIVPCHRAVGSGGGLTGYRWGVRRKKALLEREGALPAAEGEGA